MRELKVKETERGMSHTQLVKLGYSYNRYIIADLTEKPFSFSEAIVRDMHCAVITR